MHNKSKEIGAIALYAAQYGHYPPLSLRKFCVDTGQNEKLDQMLLQWMQSKEPILDWNSFADALMRPYKKANVL